MLCSFSCHPWSSSNNWRQSGQAIQTASNDRMFQTPQTPFLFHIACHRAGNYQMKRGMHYNDSLNSGSLLYYHFTASGSSCLVILNLLCGVSFLWPLWLLVWRAHNAPDTSFTNKHLDVANWLIKKKIKVTVLCSAANGSLPKLVGHYSDCSKDDVFNLCLSFSRDIMQACLLFRSNNSSLHIAAVVDCIVLCKLLADL